ncbi:MAG: cell division protein FtsL [Rhizobacter sp.]
MAAPARRLFAELDHAQSEERQLDTEFERLKADKQSQATPLRVEKAAREKLGMRTASPAITQYVTTARAASVPGGSGQ